MGRKTVLLLSIIGLLGLAEATAQRSKPGPCATGRSRCFLPTEEAVLASSSPPVTPVASRMVTMNLRASHGGPLAHRWVELESSEGKVTIGYGPASIPFIDAGQVSVWDEQGRVERSGLHLLPTNFNYAKPPGAGRLVGAPIQLTIAQSDALVRKERHRKFIFPYIPIFHDCHTFVCTAQASALGKSTLPCYLLFKGYW